MFCHKCGTQIAEGADFCHKCGTKVVYSDTEPAKDNVVSEMITTKMHSKKLSTLVAPLIIIVIFAVLILSGTLQDIGHKLTAINQEIERRATDSTLVPDMQSPNDLFPAGADSASVQSAESSFAWVEEAHMVTEGDTYKRRYIVGAIQNISDITFVSTSVQFILYDSAGNQIGTTLDAIIDFKAGNTWKFKAPVSSDDVDYFEFLQATKTYPKQ